jgi:hypothetical protein
MFPFIHSFLIDDPTEFSNHSCLSLVLRIEFPQRLNDAMKLSSHPISFTVSGSENHKEILQNVMNSEEVKNKLNALFFQEPENKPSDVNVLVNNFTEILYVILLKQFWS